MESAKVAGVEVSTAHFIDGKRVASKRTFQDCSPIDGKHLADVSAGGAAEIDSAVAAARRAFPKWAALGPDGRHRILKKFSQAILDHGKELAAVETTDNGSLLMGNLARVIPRAALNIEFFAERALKLGHEQIDSPEVVNHVRFDPAGVAGLITPWNGPFMLTTWKVGPALAAGDTVVVKPPEWAPLTCSLLGDLALKKYGKRVMDLAVRWVLDTPGITAALWGARHPADMQAVTGALNWKLDAYAIAAIDQILEQAIDGIPSGPIMDPKAKLRGLRPKPGEAPSPFRERPILPAASRQRWRWP